MAMPGTAGVTYTADGLEHNERGTPSSQAGDHLAQMDKRARKISQLDPGDAWASIEGEGDVAVLTFGSCTGAGARSARPARAEGRRKTGLAAAALARAARAARSARSQGVKRVLVVEQNHSGQFLRYLRARVRAARRGEEPAPPRPAAVPARRDPSRDLRNSAAYECAA